MITSRVLTDLIDPVSERARQMISRCKQEGIDLIVTATYRDLQAQERLYAQGRVVPGPIVTYAAPGDSWHNWKRAFDIVPIRNGKPVWSTRGLDKEVWMKVGKIGESCGLEWGGNFQRHPDYCHFQDRTGKTLEQLKKDAGLK